MLLLAFQAQQNQPGQFETRPSRYPYLSLNRLFSKLVFGFAFISKLVFGYVFTEENLNLFSTALSLSQSFFFTSINPFNLFSQSFAICCILSQRRSNGIADPRTVSGVHLLDESSREVFPSFCSEG